MAPRSPKGKGRASPVRDAPSRPARSPTRTGAIRKPSQAKRGRPTRLNLEKDDALGESSRRPINITKDNGKIMIERLAPSPEIQERYLDGLTRIEQIRLALHDDIEDIHDERRRRSGDSDSPRLETYEEIQKHIVEKLWPPPEPAASPSRALPSPDSPTQIQKRRLRDIEFDEMIAQDEKLHQRMVTLKGIEEWWISNAEKWDFQTKVLASERCFLAQPDLGFQARENHQRNVQTLNAWFKKNLIMQAMVLSHLKRLETEEHRDTLGPVTPGSAPMHFDEFSYNHEVDVRRSWWFKQYGFDWWVRCVIWDLEEKLRDLTETWTFSERASQVNERLCRVQIDALKEEKIRTREIMGRLNDKMASLRLAEKRNNDKDQSRSIRKQRSECREEIQAERRRHEAEEAVLKGFRDSYHEKFASHLIKFNDYTHQINRMRRMTELATSVSRNWSDPVVLLPTQFINNFHRLMCSYDTAHTRVQELLSFFQSDALVRGKRNQVRQLYMEIAKAGEFNLDGNIAVNKLFSVKAWLDYEQNYISPWSKTVDSVNIKIRETINSAEPDFPLVEPGQIDTNLRELDQGFAAEEPSIDVDDVHPTRMPLRSPVTARPADSITNATVILEMTFVYRKGDRQARPVTLRDDITQTFLSPDIAYHFKDLNRRSEPLADFVARFNGYLDRKNHYTENEIKAFLIECNHIKSLFKLDIDRVTPINFGWDFVAEHPVFGCPRSFPSFEREDSYEVIMAWLIRHKNAKDFTNPERSITTLQFHRVLMGIQQRDWNNSIKGANPLDYLNTKPKVIRFLEYCSERGKFFVFTNPRVLQPDGTYMITRVDEGWEHPMNKRSFVPLPSSAKPANWNYLRSTIAKREVQKYLETPEATKGLVTEEDFYRFFYSTFMKDGYFLTYYEFHHFLRWCDSTNDLFTMTRDLKRVTKIDEGWPSKGWFRK